MAKYTFSFRITPIGRNISTEGARHIHKQDDYFNDENEAFSACLSKLNVNSCPREKIETFEKEWEAGDHSHSISWNLDHDYRYHLTILKEKKIINSPSSDFVINV